MMNRQEYLENIFKNFNNGKISEEVYDAMLLQVDAFCYEDENEEDN